MQLDAAETKKGIVVLLDALGVQNKTLEESLKFIKYVHKHTSEDLPRYLGSLAKTRGKRFKVPEESIDNPVIRTFGDTILITWEAKDDESLRPKLDAISAAIGRIIFDAIENDFLFRGAISIGDYIESKLTILGPAITDAAMWYEEANWFGCICTPKANRIINYFHSDKKTIAPGVLAEYEPPLKNSNNMTMWCIDWPACFVSHNPDKDPLNWYYRTISKYEIPKGTESKFENSEKFLNDSLKRNAKLFERYRDEHNKGGA